MWKLGGKHSSFTMGPAHKLRVAARRHPPAGRPTDPLRRRQRPKGGEPVPRAGDPHRAGKAGRRSCISISHSPPTLASVPRQRSDSPGRQRVRWLGLKTVLFSEYTPSGNQLFGGSFVSPVASYRAYRFGWVGKPAATPRHCGRAVLDAGRGQRVCELERSHPGGKWQVLRPPAAVGPSPQSARPLHGRASRPRSSTRMPTTSRSKRSTRSGARPGDLGCRRRALGDPRRLAPTIEGVQVVRRANR